MNRYLIAATVSAIALSVASTVIAADPPSQDELAASSATPNQNSNSEACLTQGEDLFRNPFSKESAHHRPIGQNATFSSEGDPITSQIQRAGFNSINSPATSGYGFTLVEAKEGDPSVNVTYAGPGGPHGLPVTVKVPKEALAPSGREGILVVYDATTKKAHEFWHWKANGNNSATASIHHEWSPEEKGHTQPGGERVGLSASGVAGMFGIIRGHEVNTPGCKIQHASQITLSLKGKCNSMVSNETVGPASSTDGSCKEGACNGAIPYGTLLAIPPKPSVPLDSLKLSEPGSRLAEALQNYGTYVVDTTGSCPNMRADQELTKETQQQLTTDMHKLFPLLRAVTNNNIEDPTAGGGAPCAENTAFDAQEVDEAVVSCSGDQKAAEIIPPFVPPLNDASDPVLKDPPENDPSQDTPTNDLPLTDLPNPPMKDPPPTEEEPTTWKEETSAWLWEHLPRTAEGLQLFRDWLTEFWT